MSTRYTAKGTELLIGSATPPVVAPNTVVALLRDGSFKGAEIGMIDVSVLADDFREFLPGLGEPMSVDAEFIWDPADTNMVTIQTNWLAKTKMTFGLRFPDAGTAVLWSQGWVTNLTVNAGLDSELVATVTFSGTGAPTFVP
jgi:hypothetical protein